MSSTDLDDDDDFSDSDVLIDDEEDDVLIDEDEEEDDDEKLEDDIEIDEEEFDKEKDEEEDYEDKEEDEDIDIDIEDDIKINKNIPSNNFITVPFITKYEYPKIISTRAQQIANGSPIYIDIKNIKNKNPMNIAEIEFKEGKLNNFIIIRTLPNGKVEKRKLSELKLYSFY